MKQVRFKPAVKELWMSRVKEEVMGERIGESEMEELVPE